MKHIIKGVIKDTTQVQQFKKKNGETNVKCVLHIVAPGDDPHPYRLGSSGGLHPAYAISTG